MESRIKNQQQLDTSGYFLIILYSLALANKLILWRDVCSSVSLSADC